MTSSEGTCVSPKCVEIVIFEDRYANHVIRVMSRGLTMTATIPRKERTPLHHSSVDIGRLIEEILR